MKTQFIKEYGKVVEKLEIDHEPKYVYIKYHKGNFEKTYYISKHDPNAVNDFLDKFFAEYYVAPEIQKGVINVLKQEVTVNVQSNWQEFVNFLTITLSLHLMVGVALGVSIFGGYKLGAKVDALLKMEPSFTIVGVMFGLGIGALVGYMMIYNYFGRHSKIKKVEEEVIKKNKEKGADWPVIDISVNEIREAVRLFSIDLPKGLKRTILIKSDYSIDFEQLAPYLGGIPAKPFYMSKETYDVYEEGHIPPVIDQVQKAVNLFYKKHNQYPIRPYDSLRRVNYHQLLQGHYLDEMPEMEFYFTEYDGLITNQKPEKKLVGG